MSPQVQKAVAELRKPAAKRTMGHDRDPLGFLILLDLAADSDELGRIEFPRVIGCGTCRFCDAVDMDKSPCGACLDDDDPDGARFPKWRRR